MNELSKPELSQRTRFILFIALFVTTYSTMSAAEERPITQQDALRTAALNNPDLRAALLEVLRSEQGVLVEEDRYSPVLKFDAGVTHATSPSLSSAGGVITSESDVIALGQQIAKTFPWGTSFSVRLEQTRSSRSAQLFTGSADEITLGPGYNVLGRLAVAQPLLRGMGSDVGEAQLRAARINRTIAQRARDGAASHLLGDVLRAYWELWYAGEAVRIESAARSLATVQLGDARARIVAGADAAVAVLTFESRAAELDESQLRAQLERQRRSMDLARLLGQPGSGSGDWVAPTGGVPETPPPESDETIVRLALQESAQLRELRARVGLAGEQLKTAGEADRQRLDIEAYVQADGLGNNDVPAALEQFGTLGAVSAHVGLEWEIPVASSRYQGEVARAGYARAIATQQLRAARDRIETETRQTLLQEHAARKRVELAQRTLELRTAQLAATRARFTLGNAIAIEVLEAEDSVRRARLRLVRARIDVVLAEVTRASLTGELLLRHRALLRRAHAQSVHGALLPVRPLF